MSPSVQVPTPFVYIDFSKDDSNTHSFSLENGATIASIAPANVPKALRIDSEGPHAVISGVDISPSNMSDCTVVIGVYLDSATNNKGCMIGNHELGSNNFIQHDISPANVASFADNGFTFWEDTFSPDIHKWMHIVAVFRQNGDSFLYKDGVRSPRSALGINSGGSGDLIIGGSKESVGGWVDSWVKEVQVFNSALEDDQVLHLSDKFHDEIKSFTT